MAATQTWRRVWVLGLLVVVMVLLLLPSAAWGIPGEYFTIDELLNKRLPVFLESDATGSREACQKKCVANDKCNAFAVSEFEANCYLYNNDPDSKPVKYNTYTLYILRLKESDGYYVDGLDYYKFFTDVRLNAIEAAQYCKKEGGKLATVKTAKVNHLVKKRLKAHDAWYAYIGVSDMQNEEVWRYSDGTALGYNNWASGKKWPSQGRDCAFIDIEGFWQHADCWDKHYFVCQIPMF